MDSPPKFSVKTCMTEIPEPPTGMDLVLTYATTVLIMTNYNVQHYAADVPVVEYRSRNDPRCGSNLTRGSSASNSASYRQRDGK